MTTHNGANYGHWKTLLGRFRRQRVAVFGDLMADQYVWGTVARISPEAPVPVVQVERESLVPGGACNVAANLAALGATAVLFGLVGCDLPGELLLAECRRRGVQTDGVLGDASRPTTVKTRVVAQNQQVVRVDREQGREIAAPHAEKLLAELARAVHSVRAVVVSDYDKGVVTPQTLRAVSRLCRSAGVLLFVDCKHRKVGSAFWLLAVTPNEQELAALSGQSLDGGNGLRAAAERLFRSWKVSQILVTRGPRGMVLFERSGKCHTAPALAREVFDVTGAGDTVIATFALAVASGARPRDAVMLSSMAAAQVVSKVGTATTSPEEILAAARAIPARRHRENSKA